MFHCSVIKDHFFRIAVCLKQLCYYIMLFPACQELFSTFLKLFLFLSCINSDILSHPTGCCQELFLFLFDSFVISVRSLRRNSYILSRVFLDVKNFFHLFFIQRRRRDLNPRAAINDLHPFQGCPFGQLGYFSEYITRYLIRSLKISNSIVFLMSGEDGIRTHVPLRTNGFQDRLVMTTSIPLQCNQRN